MRILVADVVKVSGNAMNLVWVQGDEAFHSLGTCECCGNKTIDYSYNDEQRNYYTNPMTICHKCMIRGIK
jgi:hypothetical protein